jgi:hypothetical protein
LGYAGRCLPTAARGKGEHQTRNSGRIVTESKPPNEPCVLAFNGEFSDPTLDADKAASVTFAIKQSVFIFRRQRDKRAPGPTSIRSSKNNRRGLILTFLPYQRPK